MDTNMSTEFISTTNFHDPSTNAPNAWIQICQLNCSQQPISMINPQILCKWMSGTLFWCWNYWAVWREIENTYDNIWQRLSAPMQNGRLDYYLFSLTQFQSTLRQVSTLSWHHLVAEVQLELWEPRRSWQAVFDNSLIVKHFEVWEIGRKMLQPPIVG